jgi:glyoxylase-like metal-dependent hydrolase (beta-lactamase superfamily II)
LFLDGCGRTDLPGSDAGQMFESLQVLDALPEWTVVYPGHRYSVPPSETLAEVRSHNFVLKPKTKDQWMTIFGGG